MTRVYSQTTAKQDYVHSSMSRVIHGRSNTYFAPVASRVVGMLGPEYARSDSGYARIDRGYARSDCGAFTVVEFRTL